jgi:uncharacterized membrane protein
MDTGRKDAVTAWFAALCFFLSTLEYMIPKPLPFLRLGLANLPIMLAIAVLPPRQFLALVLAKILGQGLVGGTLFSYIFAFSAVGTVASALVMYALGKAFPRSLSYVGISVAGAFASNAAQLTLARWYIFGESAWYIAPPFCAVGVVTGAALGIFANHYARSSSWYRDVREGKLASLRRDASAASAGVLAEAGLWQSAAFRVPCGIALIVALMFSPGIPARAIVAAAALVLALSDRSRIRAVPAIAMALSVVAFNLAVPFGKVLASPFGLPVTAGALETGIKKALEIEGMLFVSKWMLKPGIRLPGKAGTLVSEAFSLAGALTAGRKRLNPRNLVASLDAIMSERG